jgi:transcriptional regulator with XRE-family HTH domain
MESISESLGPVVRKRREALRLSQEQLAARAGIHRTYVSSIELGKVRLGIDIAQKVAKALEIPLSVLIADAERASSKTSGRRRFPSE